MKEKFRGNKKSKRNNRNKSKKHNKNKGNKKSKKHRGMILGKITNNRRLKNKVPRNLGQKIKA